MGNGLVQLIRMEKSIKQMWVKIAPSTSGMTACSLALAAYMCGKQDVSVYDGSWMEYYDRRVRVEE